MHREGPKGEGWNVFGPTPHAQLHDATLFGSLSSVQLSVSRSIDRKHGTLARGGSNINPYSAELIVYNHGD